MTNGHTIFIAYNVIMGISGAVTWITTSGLTAMATVLTFLTSPIGIAVVAIGTIFAVLVALEKKFKLVTKAIRAFSNVWKNISGGGKDVKSSTAATKKPPGYATGTSYFSGGDAKVNEGGRGEIINLPSGTDIIPHDISKKAAGKSRDVNVSITVQGNVIGNQEFLNQMGNMFAGKIKLALANI